MRDQETDLGCLVEEADEMRPMRMRYGITAWEATHHEPLAVGLSQEEPDLRVDDDGVWDDVEVQRDGLLRTKPSGSMDALDEEQVSPAAEHAAVHDVAFVGG